MHTLCEMMLAKCTNVLFTFRNVSCIIVVFIRTVVMLVQRFLSGQCSDLLGVQEFRLVTEVYKFDDKR